MSKQIKDRFTKLKVSRQRKYQLRRQALGWCVAGGCRRLAVGGTTMCKDHLIGMRERMRTKLGCVKRFTNSTSYKA